MKEQVTYNKYKTVTELRISSFFKSFEMTTILKLNITR